MIDPGLAQGARIFLHYLRQTEASSGNDTAVQADAPGERFYHAQQAKSIDEVLTGIREMGVEADAFVPSGAELDNKLVELWTDRPGA
jgi:hypothetical protein